MITKINGYTVQFENSVELHTIKNEIFSNGIYSFPDIKSDSPVIIDVGSHIGLSIIYFKDLYPNSKIVGFEPNPKLHSILEENIFLNNLSDVVIHNIGLSNYEGNVKFYIDSENSNWYSTGSLRKGGWSGKESNTEIEVSISKLSNYISEFKSIDILKIDSEGEELNIIKDIHDYLNLINNIVIEYHPLYSFEKLVEILTRSGFTLEYIVNGRIVKKVDNSKLCIVKGYRNAKG